jgi:hypothetical protein
MPFKREKQTFYVILLKHPDILQYNHILPFKRRFNNNVLNWSLLNIRQKKWTTAMLFGNLDMQMP